MLRRCRVRGCRAFASLSPYHPAMHFESDPELFEVRDDIEAWSIVDKEAKMREIGLQIRPGFASAREQEAIVAELEQGPFKRLKWDVGHWDAVITNYRETERALWKETKSAAVVQRMKDCFPASWGWRPQHILDLKAEGEIAPHIDAISTVGDVVSGLTLLSPAVMTFSDEDDDEIFAIHLLPGSLYIMAGESRFRFKHAIMLKDQHFGGHAIDKQRRISLMIRDYAEGTDFSQRF